MKRNEFIKTIALGSAALAVGLPTVAEPIKEYTFFELMQLPGAYADFYRLEKQDQKSYLWINIPREHKLGYFTIKHLPIVKVPGVPLHVEIESVEELKQLASTLRKDIERDLTNTHSNACRTFLSEVEVMYSRLNVDYYLGCSLQYLGLDKHYYNLYMHGYHNHLSDRENSAYLLWRKFYDGYDHAGRVDWSKDPDGRTSPTISHLS